MLMCSEVIDRTETTMHNLNSDGLDGEGGYSELASKELISAAKIIVDKDGETLTYDKAKKIMKRSEVMRRLREDVLRIPDLAEKLDNIPRPTASGSLPPWFRPEHDYPLLHAVATWGLLRGDLILQDESFPFHDLHLNHIKATGLEKESGVSPPDLIAGKMEDRFWIRDHALFKRIEYFCDHLGKKNVKRGPKRARKKAIQWTPLDTESDEEPISAPNTSFNGPKLKLKLNISKQSLESESKIEKQERRRKRIEKNSEIRKSEETHTLASDDTDAMLEDVENRLSRRAPRGSETQSASRSDSSNSNDPDVSSTSNIPSLSVNENTLDDEIKIPPRPLTRPQSCTSISSLVNGDSTENINILGKRDTCDLLAEEDVKRVKLQE